MFTNMARMPALFCLLENAIEKYIVNVYTFTANMGAHGRAALQLHSLRAQNLE